jgi:hypothetical protein
VSGGGPVNDAVYGGDAWCESAVAWTTVVAWRGQGQRQWCGSHTFYDYYHCFLCEYMFMMFMLVTCLSVVYSSNRICMNLALIIYASLKHKTMSKTDQIQVFTVEYADS